MSNSESLVVKEVQEGSVELELLDECHSSASSSDAPYRQDHKESSLEKTCKIPVPSQEKSERPLSGNSEVAVDDEGFKTPTSEDQKIQLIKRCPPAPRKPKPFTTASARLRRRKILHVHLQELESVLLPNKRLREPDRDSERKVQKARRNGEPGDH